MRVTFRGVRGSIPAPLSRADFAAKAHALIAAARDPARRRLDADALLAALPPGEADLVGGNSICFEVNAGGRLLVFDAGSGIRRLGLDLMQGDYGRGQGRLDLFLSHTHWDHVLGFPFFAPVFTRGNVITVRSPIADVEARLRTLFDPAFFPVPWDEVRPRLRFERMADGEILRLGDVAVTPCAVPHPGGCYAYRVEHAGKAFVFATDIEWGRRAPHSEEAYYAFFGGADLVAFDAAYAEADVPERIGWGHSTPTQAVDLALRAGAKRLALFHHEPSYPYTRIEEIGLRARAYCAQAAPDAALDIFLAREDMVVEL